MKKIYVITNRSSVYIYILSILLLSILTLRCSYAQTVTGTLKDRDGLPLALVTVGLSVGEAHTSSDQHGFFQIQLTTACDTLLFSGVHITTVRQPVCAGDHLDITLDRQQNHLDEVLVMGYSTTTERYRVGSVSKVQGLDIASQPVGNPLLALHGRVPGMIVSASGGHPGASVSIQVRGQNAMKPDQFGRHYVDPPLFIIDGIPFSPQNQNLNQYRSVLSPQSTENPYGGFSPFNSIDPQSIESIEVLKDADATAIYGSRGGNGVVLITTKAGKSGKTQIDAKMEHGMSWVGRTMPMMNTSAYLDMRREALRNDGAEPNLTPSSPSFAPDLLVFDQETSQDWKRYFMGNTARNSQVNLSLGGGSELTRFLIGGTFRKDSYVYPGGFSDWKANFNSNIQHQSPDRRFLMNLSLLYSHNKNTSVSTPNIISAFNRMPNYPDPLDEAGNLVWEYGGLNFSNAVLDNPIAYLYHPYEMKNTMLNASMLLNYRLMDGLAARLNMGYNSMGSAEWTAFTKEGSTPYATTNLRAASFGSNYFSGWVIEPQLTYEKIFSKGVLTFLAGSSFQWDSNRMTSIQTRSHLDDGLLRSISAAPTSSASDNDAEYKFMAVFGRLSYIWDKKIISNVTWRRDGSSRFGPEKRFGNFGSIGLGWIIRDQRDPGTLWSFGKIRGSWGVTGSDNTSPYQYISRWSPVLGGYDGHMGYAPMNLFNAELQWARTAKLEFGADLGFWQDRVYMTASWYQNRSSNQLINYALPSQAGFNTIAVNWDAVVQNTGLEFTLQAGAYKSEHFSWTLGGNISVPKNILKRFDGIETSSYSTRYMVGKSLNLLLGLEYAGVNPETGLFEYYTADGERTSSPKVPSSGLLHDFKYLGNLDARYYGGVNNQLQYRNWSLGFFIEFRSRQGANFLRQVYSGAVPGGPYNIPAVMEDRWKEPGDMSLYMKATTISGSRNPAGQRFPSSSGAYGDASYARLKHATLVWRLPRTGKTGGLFSDLAISLSGYNLLTWTSYEGNDPETLSFYAVPPLRTFVIGLQAKF